MTGQNPAMHEGRVTYPPLNTLKPVAEDVWIADGPAIRFGPPGLKLPFPTRMTVIRTGGGLFLHSPTAITPSLGFETAQLGLPRWIVAPNRLHSWWIPDWHRAFPAAEIYLAPKVREQAKGRIDFDAPPRPRGRLSLGRRDRGAAGRGPLHDRDRVLPSREPDARAPT